MLIMSKFEKDLGIKIVVFGLPSTLVAYFVSMPNNKAIILPQKAPSICINRNASSVLDLSKITGI